MKLYSYCAATCLYKDWVWDHKAHVQIPVYRGITATELRKEIISKLSQGAIEGNDDIAVKLQNHDKATYRAAVAAVNRAQKGKQKLLMDLPEYDETVYSFFIFSKD